MKNNCIAIIPAKAISSRLPNKNIKTFLNKPIIGMTIETLKKSKIFDKIIVSTDSTKIAHIAKKYGAEVPFLRPKKIAHKVISTRPSINHCINFLIKKKFKFDYVCEVYPANPFLKISDLKEGKKKIIEQKTQFVFSATNYLFPYYRSFLFMKGALKPIFKSNIKKGSQNLRKIMCDAAQFYWAHKNTWRKDKISIFSPQSSVIRIPSIRYHDIDTPEDWTRAELFYKVLKTKKKI
tara:strand:- start:18463 stop:19170 length:708 start_codon:yes stop_codon:yes gene_type:complete